MDPIGGQLDTATDNGLMAPSPTNTGTTPYPYPGTTTGTVGMPQAPNGIVFI